MKCEINFILTFLRITADPFARAFGYLNSSPEPSFLFIVTHFYERVALGMS